MGKSLNLSDVFKFPFICVPANLLLLLVLLVLLPFNGHYTGQPALSGSPS